MKKMRDMGSPVKQARPVWCPGVQLCPCVLLESSQHLTGW